jgi:hypothetical protein
MGGPEEDRRMSAAPSAKPALAAVPAAAAGPALQSAAPSSGGAVDMRYLVRALIKYQASDLHLRVGRPPLYRINGRLIPAKMQEMEDRALRALLMNVMSDQQKAKLERERQVDFSFREGDLGRFRCNLFYQRGTLSAAVRMVPLTTPSLDDLGVPAVAKDLCQRPRGLVLVTGATGSGKSTTLAGMVQFINETQPLHVLTIGIRSSSCTATSRPRSPSARSDPTSRRSKRDSRADSARTPMSS